MRKITYKAVIAADPGREYLITVRARSITNGFHAAANEARKLTKQERGEALHSVEFWIMGEAPGAEDNGSKLSVVRMLNKRGE